MITENLIRGFVVGLVVGVITWVLYHVLVFTVTAWRGLGTSTDEPPEGWDDTWDPQYASSPGISKLIRLNGLPYNNGMFYAENDEGGNTVIFVSWRQRQEQPTLLLEGPAIDTSLRWAFDLQDAVEAYFESEKARRDKWVLF
jgi:hypothetical protein